MKLGIDFSQPSTQRGSVWVIVFIAGTVGWWMGKDPTALILLGTGVAGAIGVATKD
jgi:hypothetical protein